MIAARTASRLAGLFLILALFVGVAAIGAYADNPRAGVPALGGSSDSVSILGGKPVTLDPAAQGDTNSSVVIAQVFEGLTTFDPGLTVRPALAQSWDVLDGGTRLVFHLRPGVEFSDGTPIHGADVVRSWLRVIDPSSPSPLASLMSDVTGADDYLAGKSHDPASVGLSANGDDVEVRLIRPASDFPAIIASTSFAIVPPGVGTNPAALTPGPEFVGSGGYTVTAEADDHLTLTANDHYWAGRPAIGTVNLVTDLGGKSPVDEFENGDLDYTFLSDDDASWISYDPTLGPDLRLVPSLGTTYYGFDTTRAPFNDPRVRQAFAMAVDWKRDVLLAGPASQVPATSMVPPGIPGRSDTDFSPAYDPTAAKAALAAAGFPGGAGFPDVTLVTSGGSVDDAIVAQIKDVLGITLHYETMEFEDYFPRLASDPPAMWSLTWNADYPGANDFLGLLLGTGQANNNGHWSNADFDAAIAKAAAATNAQDEESAFDEAQAIVKDQAPVVPVSNGTGYALARDGLLGAVDNGLGIIRFAGLSWAK